MIGKRIKQFRLAKGYSLDDLQVATGGLVSKVALSKYERNIMKPSPKVLMAIAKALETKTVYLLEESSLCIDLIAFRIKSSGSIKEREKVENLVRSELEERTRFQHIFSSNVSSNLPVAKYKTATFKDVEESAKQLRKEWDLGTDPIPNLTNLLEQHNIHVIQIDSYKEFDGVAAICKDSEDKVVSAAVVTNQNPDGERQRFNLGHELGHLILVIELKNSSNEEKFAHRFSSAFLAPKEEVFRTIGKKRTSFQLDELLILKKHFGLSLQALIFRFFDLDIITRSTYSFWFRWINVNGYKIHEPEPLPFEKATMWEKSILSAFSENLITRQEAERLLKRNLEERNKLVVSTKEFLKFSIEDRRKLLAHQAEKLKENYSYEEIEMISDDL